jgi:magnesium-transporting ATPase (P-type)
VGPGLELRTAADDKGLGFGCVLPSAQSKQANQTGKPGNMANESRNPDFLQLEIDSTNPLVSAEFEAQSAEREQALAGLTTVEVEQARQRFGFNERRERKTPLIDKLFSCFNNSVFLESMRKNDSDIMSKTPISVKRNGKFETMQAQYLVPGDLIMVTPDLVVRLSVYISLFRSIILCL